MGLRNNFLTLSTLFFFVATLPVVSTAGGVSVVCPTNIAPVVAAVTEVYNGQRSQFVWSFSPTAPSDAHPVDALDPCGRTYMGRYPQAAGVTGACVGRLNFITRAPAIIAKSYCEYYLNDGARSFATLRLSCNASAATMAIGPTATVTDTIMEATAYSFVGSYAGVCGGSDDEETTTAAPPTTEAPPTTTVAPAVVCPTDISPVVAAVTEVYNGQRSQFVWSVSPTAPSDAHPADSFAPCGRTYMGRYPLEGGVVGSCERRFDVVTRPPAIITNAFCEYYLNDGVRSLATLRLSCNASAATMAIDRTVSVVDTIMESVAFALTGSYAGVCAGASMAHGHGRGSLSALKAGH